MEEWLREVDSTAGHCAAQEAVGGEDGSGVLRIRDGEVHEDAVYELGCKVSLIVSLLPFIW